MAAIEQIEAWSKEAVDALTSKIGPGAQVILMVTDISNDDAPFLVERRGHHIGLAWLMYVGQRTFEDITVPKSTFKRKD